MLMSKIAGKPLVIGLSSRALLNLEKEDLVYREDGVQAFIITARTPERAYSEGCSISAREELT